MAQSQAYDINVSQWPEFVGFKKLKSNCKEIRVLQLETKPGVESMNYALRHESLHDKPDYCAVSYSWGAPVPDVARKKIFIDGEPVLLRPTLYTFLATMSVHYPTARMWVDAICINQNDFKERNDQISVMGEIYESAQEVFVWLGPGDDDTNYAMEHIESPCPLTPYYPSIFCTCAEKLFRVPFFTRRWVIQEVSLAKRLTMVCGDRSSSWHNFVTKVNDEVLANDASASQTLENFKSTRLLGSHRQASLLDLMERFRDARCIDQRDRAFALRSIAADGHRLSPHYDESITDSYLRFLSMLPTEGVLPAMSGYRWPSNAASRVLDLFLLRRQDLLDGLKDNPDDRLFAVLEYRGTVETVTSLRDDKTNHGHVEHHPSFPLRAWCSESSAGFWIASENLLPGDSIYSLGSTPRPMTGLYVAFRPSTSEPISIGLLIQEPAYSYTMCIHKKSVEHIKNITLRGMLICARNNCDIPPLSKLLCHINRSVLMMLWFLYFREGDYLLERIAGNVDNLDILGSFNQARLQCECAKQGRGPR